MARNYQGLLVQVQEHVLDSAINLEILSQEIAYRQQHTVIATFTRLLRNEGESVTWLRALTTTASHGRILHHCNASRGFICVTIDAPATTHHLLLASPH